MNPPFDPYLHLRRELAVQVQRSTADETAARGPEMARRGALRVLDVQVRKIPPGDRRSPDCAAGCSMCCHLRVAATPVEVFGLIDYMEQRLVDAEFKAFTQRVAAAAARVHALTPTQRLTTNIACPVLVDGCCGGYAGRPFNCRAYHSLDVAACRASFEDPGNLDLGHPQNAAVARVNEGVQRGFIDGQREAGYDSEQRELATALHEAIRDPEARQRFARRERALLKAVPL